MSSPEEEHPADQLANNLAAYDDFLFVGKTRPPPELEQAVDPARLDDWNRLTSLLMLVERAWPRTDQEHTSLTSLPPAASSQTTLNAAEPSSDGSGSFGRFQIIRTLGQGGFGIVFLAWDPALRRQVALKVPQPETLVTPEARKRFQREAHAAAGLDHPNIVSVYETGSVGSVTYIAAAYCAGPTLAQWLAHQRQPTSNREAARLVATLARAVEHAHARGVLHRDLKPSNILLKPSIGDDTIVHDNLPLAGFEPRITDFSLAKIADGLGPDTESGVPFGSPPYMAPEQAEGKLKAIGPPTDVYGLGCMLYEVLTGSPPFRGEGQLDTLRRVIADAPIAPRRLRKDTPLELEAVVLRCLEKEPARRFPSARELADDLDRFLANEPTKTRPAGRWNQLRKMAGRHLAGLIVVVILCLLVCVFYLSVYRFKSRLDESRNLAFQREDTLRRHDLSARRVRYLADVRRALQWIGEFQPLSAMSLLTRQRPGPGEVDLREFTWHQLLSRCHTEKVTLWGHNGDVYHAEFSIDGQSLATTGKDGTVRLWDGRTGEFRKSFQAHDDEVNWVTFAPDGQSVATCGDDGTVRLRNLSGTRPPVVIAAHRGMAVIVLFSPGGDRLISCGSTDGEVKTWSASDGAAIGSFHVDARGIDNMAISPDGATVALVGSSRLAAIWNVAARKQVADLGPHGGDVKAVAFSRDGRKVATGCDDTIVRLFDLPDGQLVREYKGHTGSVQSIAFADGDQTMISAGDDRTIRNWDVAKGTCRGVHMGHHDRVWGVSSSPDSRIIASSSRDGTAKLWNFLPPETPVVVPVDQRLDAMDFSADGQTLVAASHSGLISRTNASTAVRLETIQISNEHISQGLNLHRSGTIAVILRDNGYVDIHDLVERKHVSTIGPFAGRVRSSALDSQGRRIVVAVENEGLSLWDASGKRQSHDLKGEFDEVRFSLRGQVLARDVLDWNLVSWDPSQGEVTKTLALGWQGCSAVSPDNALFAYVHFSTIRLSSRFSSTHLMTLDGHSGKVLSLAFSPDGKTLASGGDHGSLKLWDVTTGEELISLEGATDEIRLICFSPDGRTLAAYHQRPSVPGEVLLWHTLDEEPQPDVHTHTIR
jgi:WD40 repeat protein/serine/threonine protein kinase